ncbi:4-hydroxybenzoate octaprenyltransferase [Devosia nitrariae]|uniref:4-hydroxybenzoate octaprenyltransferase n=1 Tax=Devosia nitrariae TaxID=2071872 RepID=A0ABQ5VZR7_9HYPH|nr:4-hydroxybenzoate octaprenyltransferase [Devosia nitrariae]GLQ52943.1 4-hydroxybenzoate octaprenyltransferase [Devosia nitrariae]
MATPTDPGSVADAQRGNWVDSYAPGWLKPYARLARWDRPIGVYLLFWPCAWSLALAAVRQPANGFDAVALIYCFVGAVLMRGAGCTFNDIVDRDIDMKVARTRLRPIPSGQLTTRNAVIFLVAQALLAFLILIQFNTFTVAIGIASLVLVAVYPFMKRVTWWPQLFLGLAFSWGALVGWSSQTSSIGPAPLLLYLGCILWTIGYDTIYALQDIEDDALIGVKSTARLFGENVKPIVGLFYAATVACWLAAGFVSGAGWVLALGLVPVAAMLAWQVMTLDARAPANAYNRFYSNHYVGLVLTGAILLEWMF